MEENEHVFALLHILLTRPLLSWYKYSIQWLYGHDSAAVFNDCTDTIVLQYPTIVRTWFCCSIQWLYEHDCAAVFNDCTDMIVLQYSMIVQTWFCCSIQWLYRHDCAAVFNDCMDMALLNALILNLRSTLKSLDHCTAQWNIVPQCIINPFLENYCMRYNDINWHNSLHKPLVVVVF